MLRFVALSIPSGLVPVVLLCLQSREAGRHLDDVASEPAEDGAAGEDEPEQHLRVTCACGCSDDRKSCAPRCDRSEASERTLTANEQKTHENASR